MQSTQKFHNNIAKIDTLAISFYEKDVVRSAYYNYINDIPIAPHATALLKKYNITFSNGNIDISNMDREKRKKLYKRRSDTDINTQPTNTYAKSFLDINTKQNTLTQLLAKGEQTFKETQKFIEKCEELTDACFKESELSYSMTKNMIDKLDVGAKTIIKTLSDFLQPFIDTFEVLQPTEQKEILKQTNDFMEKIQQTKDTSIKLCVELSKIRVHQAMPNEQDYIKYINNTIKQFDNYIK